MRPGPDPLRSGSEAGKSSLSLAGGEVQAASSTTVWLSQHHSSTRPRLMKSIFIILQVQQIPCLFVCIQPESPWQLWCEESVPEGETERGNKKSSVSHAGHPRNLFTIKGCMGVQSVYVRLKTVPNLLKKKKKSDSLFALLSLSEQKALLWTGKTQ